MKPLIAHDEFLKLDIRIGTIESVEIVEDADKLLRFIFDLGSEKCEIIAGMRPFITDLNMIIGKQMPVLCNVEPRNFRGHTSHGMIVAADHEGRPIFLSPDSSIPAGSIVK